MQSSCIALALAAALVIPAGSAVPVAAKSFHIGFPGGLEYVDDDNGSLRLRLSDDGRTIKAEAKGTFDFTDDETDFAAVSAGGWFWIEERRRGRTTHRIEVRGKDDGTFERLYAVNGQAQAFDTDGRAWLADILGVIFRNTGFAAESHIRRVFKRAGVDRALAEIAQMESDHTQRKCYGYLLEAAPGDADAARRIAQQAGEELGSDHELAEMLATIVDAQPKNEDVLLACAEASRHLGSDHERNRALSRLVEAEGTSAAVLEAALSSAKAIGSDHERAEFLILTAQQHPLDAALAPGYFDTVHGIGSDHECGRVLREVLSRSDLPAAVLDPLLESARRIGSDHEKAEVLIRCADSQTLDGDLRPAFIETMRTIGSDHERGRVQDRLGEKGL